VWLIILIVLFVILVWPLVSPLQLQIDTRVPEVYLRWISVGKAKLVYEENKWWLSVSILFFSKKWELERLAYKRKKPGREVKPKTRRRRSKWLKRLFNMGTSFRIIRWRVAIDTGDDIRNAWLYPLNFYPAFRHHLYINFSGENYLFLQIRNAPWRMLYALMK